MKPTAPSPTPAGIDRYHKVAQVVPKLSVGGTVGQEHSGGRMSKLKLKQKRSALIPHRRNGYFEFDDELSALANRAKPSFTPIDR